MKKDILIFLEDIVKNVELIEKFTYGMDKEKFN
jgi:uncharacterized protein with HEPN domain